MSFKQHWENVYSTKKLNEVSWYQPNPATSLNFIGELGIPKDAAIIDIGGGDSFLVEHLLANGFTNITVLDISDEALNRAKERLGEKAVQVKWIASDITTFIPSEKYDCWHDRAAFHFLTTEEQIISYLSVSETALKDGGKLVIGTFSEAGPDKCSGLSVRQYSETSLTTVLKKWYEKIKCIYTDHITPFNKVQNFLFCSFKKCQYTNGYT